MSGEAVVAALQKTHGRARKACKNLAREVGGYIFKRYKSWSDEDMVELRSMSNDLPVRDVAKKFGVSISSIYGAMRRSGTPCVGPDEYSLRDLRGFLCVPQKTLQEWRDKKGLKVQSRQMGTTTVEVVLSKDLIAFLKTNSYELLFGNGSAKPPMTRLKFMHQLLAPLEVKNDRTAQTHHREQLAIDREAAAMDEDEEEFEREFEQESA